MTASSLDFGAALGSSKPLREDLGERREACAVHGEYMATGTRILLTRPPKEIWTSCPACKAAEERKAYDAAMAARQVAVKQQIEEMLVQAAIPQRFIGKTLDSYRTENDGQRKALEVCRAFAENFDRNLKTGASLVMSGMPGTGKSHLAGAILQAILPRHVGAYMTLMDLIRMLRDTWRRDSEMTESQMLAKLQELPLLVIDEVGVQYGTDGERAILFDVLDRRYRAMRPTILMTNLGKEDFRAAVGDRVFDRLTETARWLPFDWPSFRAQARREMRDAA